jgi:hypothetical protein
MHVVSWVSVVLSCDSEYCYYCGCCSVGSCYLYYWRSSLVVYVDTSGMIVGIVDCLFGMVAIVGEVVVVCSTWCRWVTGVGIGFVVACVGYYSWFVVWE